MDISPVGSKPTRRGPADSFTGTVWQDPVIEAPLGQTLHVISGVGRVQTWGGPIRPIHPGDTVWIPPGEKHWHGAAPTTGMVHIAMQESLDGNHVIWLEHVTDEQYGADVKA